MVRDIVQQIDILVKEEVSKEDAERLDKNFFILKKHRKFNGWCFAHGISKAKEPENRKERMVIITNPENLAIFMAPLGKAIKEEFERADREAESRFYPVSA